MAQFFFSRHGTDSTKARLVDGPGRCAGRLEIQYEGKWQRVAEGEATDGLPNHICQLLDCGETGTKETQGFSQGSGPFFPRALNCPTGVTRISKCIKDKVNAPGGKALALTCKSECVSRWNLTVRCVICPLTFANLTTTIAGRKYVRQTFQCVIFQNMSKSSHILLIFRSFFFHPGLLWRSLT